MGKCISCTSQDDCISQPFFHGMGETGKVEGEGLVKKKKKKGKQRVLRNWKIREKGKSIGTDGGAAGGGYCRLGGCKLPRK